MNFLQLISLLLAAVGICSTSGFTLRNTRMSQVARSSTFLSESSDKVNEIVQARVVVSGKNVQGPWYRTTVRHEVITEKEIFDLSCRCLLFRTLLSATLRSVVRHVYENMLYWGSEGWLYCLALSVCIRLPAYVHLSVCFSVFVSLSGCATVGRSACLSVFLSACRGLYRHRVPSSFVVNRMLYIPSYISSLIWYPILSHPVYSIPFPLLRTLFFLLITLL